MRRSAFVFPLVCFLGLAAAVASAQSADPNESETPLEKVRGGAVRERAPGNVINQARERHRGFINRRVNGPRSGQPVESTTGTTGTAANNAATGLNSLLGGLGGSGLLGTLSSLTGGQLSMDQMNQINNLLNGTSGTGSSASSGAASGASSNSASSGSNPNIPSNIPPDVIQTLVNAGFDLNELFPPSGTSKVVAGTTAVAADKSESRSQTNNTTTTPFPARWANAMLQTTFSALVLGFSSPDFVKLIEDALRPILLPGSIESGSSDNNTDGNNNNNNSGGNSGSIVAIPGAHRPLC